MGKFIKIIITGKYGNIQALNKGTAVKIQQGDTSDFWYAFSPGLSD